MSFTSVGFIGFVAISVCIYFIIPKMYRWVVLLVASYAFYLLSSPKSFVFLLITTVTTFFGGKAIGKCDEELKKKLSSIENIDRTEKKRLKEVTKSQKKKRMLVVLIFNFGILATMKYFRFYLEELAGMMSLSWLHFDAGILIPLGISFYTFQSMSYLIDVYRSKYAADTNIAHFALFVSWFPLIIQGPISRYDQLAHQLYEGHSFDYKRVKFGVQLMLWGFFKKLVIADRIKILVDTVFDNYTDYAGTYVIIGVIGYAIQIYADFSGGVDIAKGVSQIFGIQLVNNFERPYFAKSVPDFWRRWHMSLGQWCRDYIFYPISLSKTFGKMGKKTRKIFGDRFGKLFPVIIAQLVTFSIIGIWHGSQLKYIAYGLYQAVFIIGGILLEPWFEKWLKVLHINTEAPSWKLFQIFRTFLVSAGGRFFSRAPRLKVALLMMRSVFVFNPAVLINGALLTLGLTARDFQLLFFCLAFWICISIAQELGYSIREELAKQNILFRWMIYITAVLAIMIFGVYGIGYDAATFIYRGF